MKFKNPELSHISFSILFATISYIIFNNIIFDKFTKWFVLGSDIDYLGLTAFLIVGLGLWIAFFMLIAHRKTIKPFAIIFTALSTSATYFVSTYNVAIDNTMIENIIHTDSTESLGLLSTHMLPYLIFLFLAPTILIAITNIKFDSPIKYLSKSLLVFVLSIMISVGTFYTHFDTIQRAANQSSKYIIYSLVPINYISGIIGAIQHAVAPYFKTEKKPIKIVAETTSKNNLVVVLAIGETSRQKNFSLYGYEKNTNPLLSKRKDIHILNGIAHVGSTLYALPEILEKDGIKLPAITHKVDINTSCYVNYTLYDNCNAVGEIHAKDNKCRYGQCYDEDVIPLLNKNLKSYNFGKRFIILHMGGGSHGPRYKNRYPPKFQKFNPQCLEADIFNNCSKEQLYNSYDNTILYVDYVIDKTLKTLDNLGVPYVFIYLSDHGESLMENDRLFHGMPPGISLPSEQSHIPMIVKSSVPISIKKFDEYYQQDVFSTILDLLSIKTDTLDKNRVFIKQKGI
jgi:lipid A ethanolaminephosphotransferase